MAKIGTLTADMRLESAAFQRDLNRATKAVNSATAQMRRSMRQVDAAARRVTRSFQQLRSAGAALAGALAVRQFGVFARNALDAADSIAKVADSVGLTTMALQEYRLAAQFAGLETGKMDSALQAFAKRIGEARSGTGPLVTFLQRYNAELLESLVATESTEEALQLYLAVLAQTSNALDRAALSGAAFGRTAGASMTVLVRNASEAMDQAREAARDLGLVLAEDVARSAEAVNDRLALFGQAANVGFITGLVRELAGEFATTDDNLQAMRQAAENFGRVVGQSLRAVADAAQFVANNLRPIVGLIAGLVAGKVISGFALLAANVAKFATALRAAAVSGAFLQLLFTKSILGRAVVGGTALLGVTIATVELDDLTSQAKAATNALLGLEQQQQRMNADASAANNAAAAAAGLDDLNQKYDLAALAANRFEKTQKITGKQIAGHIGDVASVFGQALGTMFEENKAVAIGQALINTYQGITQAIANYPPPFSYAMAAAQGALGFAQVNAIRSQSKDGGGSSAAISSSAATPAVTTETAEASRAINLTLVGDQGFSRAQIEQLAEGFSDAFGDGVTIRTNTA